MLGDLGADVIKLEGPSRPDPERGPMKANPGSGGPYPDDEPGDEPYNRAGRFVEYNRNKRAVALDLKTAEGVEALKELVAGADVVIENFSVGVVQRLGIGYDDLKEVKADIIMVSMPAFGSTGPESSFVAFGPQQECLTGLVGMTGYEEDEPLLTGLFYPDPTVALFAVSAILSALWQREESGVGQHIEVAQREAVIFTMPDSLMQLGLTGSPPGPPANAHPEWAPHGCYRCAGDDKWVAVAVTSDAQWRAMAGLMGRDDLIGDARYDGAQSRIAHRKELDEVVEAWTSLRSPGEAMRELQGAGVPAGAVNNMGDLLEDAHYAERGFFLDIDYSAGVGVHPSLGFPWRFSETPASVRRPAPRFAEHTEEVLRELTGLSEDEIGGLVR